MYKNLTRFVLLLIPSLVIFLAPLTVATETAEAAGPCRVTAFSTHAKLRMAERDWSESEVKQSVSEFCADGYRQSNGNWLYPSSSGFLPTVVLSDNGTVVTVENPSDGGGGGGGGGWRMTHDE